MYHPCLTLQIHIQGVFQIPCKIELDCRQFITVKSKGASINNVSPNFGFLDPPPYPCRPSFSPKNRLKSPFLLPPSLPLKGDVVYGWSLIYIKIKVELEFFVILYLDSVWGQKWYQRDKSSALRFVISFSKLVL